MKDWRSLSLKEQIAQMIVVRASGHLFDHQIRYPAWEANNQQLKAWVEDFNLGGVILLGGSSVELQARSQQLQSWAKIPLFIAADIEEGIGQRFPGGTWFPPPMALGKIYQQNSNLARQYAYQMGEVTAQEALAVGVNWLLAPVVDVNNNPDNPAINIRAFGDRPEVVADLTTAFIQGAKSTAILTTAKHFPGHGDTSTDSHLDLPALNHSESRLATIELPPFEQAIAAGVDSVMTAHLLISAWDSELPATVSKKIVTEILRNRLGFSGLVVTDALIMGGITKYAPLETVAVMAIEAGTDILLMPDNPEVAIASIYDAVQTGQIKESRIHKSLERIWQAKQQVFTNLIGSVDVTKKLSSDRAKSTVNSILQNSLQQSKTSVITDPHSLGRNLIVVDDVLNANYLDLNSPAITIPQKYNYQRQLVDSNTLDCILLDSRPTLLQIFIRGNPFRGNAGLTDQTKAIYQKLLASQQLLGVAIYGSPYVLEWFQSMIYLDLPWVFTYGQMPQAQAIALQALFADKAHTLEFQSHDFGF
ncbi:beta-glucosidase [Pleurocapsa sp. CCALA 161]|uniref:glycoside hydrolase family 3 N-terminal domain-containing protein n=1 Tax=Pleurocapsa sp. CCALA 161 TaxID=2107688 RepID=UPI000D06ED1A|nr:glycoside hydrolase family 3 N-terminal domain-containing protein [Pleurocapsa sp. CCALA 161]PSB08819.1 beta-glucosidase [Pleurocapsa sp. CCALA 161]